KWTRELPSVLWELRTSPSRAIGETPFFLTYSSEVVLLTELEFGSRGSAISTKSYLKTVAWRIWTSSKKLGMSPQYSRLYTSRAYVAITITMFTAALSPSEIWSFARSKSVHTNSLQYGRALTSSLK